MGPLEAFEFKMEGRIVALKEALSRLETDFKVGYVQAYREQRAIDEMHAARERRPD